MNSEEKISLIKSAHDVLLNAVESFEEDNIGAAFSYLVGAILNDSKVAVCAPVESDDHCGPLYLVLTEALGASHPVFEFFEVISD